MVTAIIIFLGMLLFLLLWGKKNTSGKTTLVLVGGWLVKCLAASVFFYVYAEVYGEGELAEDPGAYIQEAKILNTVYRNNTDDYYSILFNKQGSEEKIAKYFEKVKNSRIGPKSNYINDTRNQIKFISVVTLLIGENVLGLFAFFTLLSFLGLLVLWRSLQARSTIHPNVIFLLLLLPLNLLFWSSSPLEECTSIFGLELFIASLLIISKSFLKYVIGTIGLLFAILFKPYLVAILLVSYFLVYIYRKTFIARKWSYGMTFLVVIACTFYLKIHDKILLTLSDHQYNFVNVARGGVHMEGDTCYYFLEKKNRDKIIVDDTIVKVLVAVEMIAIERGKIRHEKKSVVQPNSEVLRFEYEQFGGRSFFETRSINRSWSNLLVGAPEAIANAMLRPFPWTDFLSPKNLILFLENVFFLVLLYFTLIKKKNQRERVRIIINVLLLTSLIFALIIGFTTPISGAIVRYRIPIQLFILISFILSTKKYESSK